MDTHQLYYSLQDCIELVDITDRAIRDDKRGHIDNNFPPILQRLKIDTETWLYIATTFEDSFGPWIGPAEQIQQACINTKKHWVHRTVGCQKLYRTKFTLIHPTERFASNPNQSIHNRHIFRKTPQTNTIRILQSSLAKKMENQCPSYECVSSIAPADAVVAEVFMNDSDTVALKFTNNSSQYTCFLILH